MTKAALLIEDIEWLLLESMHRCGFKTAGRIEIYLLSGSFKVNSANWDVARFDVGADDPEAFVWALVDAAQGLQRVYDAVEEQEANRAA
jgi:hypothetical protein